MKSDSRRIGWFTVTGLDWLRGGGFEGFVWMFEGFVPLRTEELFNEDARRYFGWHPDFDKTDEGAPVPEYVAERVDGKTVWKRA